jgi:hypothetical protein
MQVVTQEVSHTFQEKLPVQPVSVSVAIVPGPLQVVVVVKVGAGRVATLRQADAELAQRSETVTQ